MFVVEISAVRICLYSSCHQTHPNLQADETLRRSAGIWHLRKWS